MSESPRQCRAAAALLLVLASPLLAAGVPDPTRPAILPSTPVAAEGTAVADLVLQSTVVAPSSRTAVINGQSYRPGDRVGDATLVAVGPGWARLRGPAGERELHLSYSNLTRPVNR